MPPTRRTSNTPQPKGRRPKIAGTGPAAARRSTDRPTEPVEPSTPSEQAPDEVAPAADAAAPDVTGAAAARPEAPGDERAAATSPGDEPDAGEGAGRPVDAGSAAADPPVAEPSAPARPVNRTTSLRPRTPSGDEGGAEAAADPAEARAGWMRVAVIGALALALGAFAVVAAFRPGATVSNRAWVDTAATTQVSAAARDAIQTLYSYKFDTVDQDFDKARAVLTDDMRTEFDKTAKVTRDAVVQTKTETNAQVTDIGVKLLDDEHAELVASMNVSASNDGVAQGSAEGPLSVTMKKVGDAWLLADIRDR
ncbi:hypothetical protein GCM10023094_42410 [Rhodococcus olei]|uniref:Mce-associated membrane protein n=1 Tax=Rhodococcus olei TaxID=2161675 RepID=A0ABP8PHF7_9NOCA